MQNSCDNLPSYLQTNIIAQMLSVGGEGVQNQEQWHCNSYGTVQLIYMYNIT